MRQIINPAELSSKTYMQSYEKDFELFIHKSLNDLRYDHPRLSYSNIDELDANWATGCEPI
jgi:hypothetical protein